MINIRIMFATLLTIVTLYFAIVSGGPSYKFFFNSHALLLVFVGTACVFIFSNSSDRIISILKLIRKIIFSDVEQDRVQIIYRLYYLSSVRKNKYPQQYFHNTIDHPFLTDSISLLDAEHMNERDFKETISKRLDLVEEDYAADAEILNALAKYPPAMGLIGATSGMISMMMSIGNGDKSFIGKAMASALVATLWGIAFSNFVLLPLADLTVRMNNENIKNRKMILDALCLIKADKDPAIVFDLILSYVPFNKRKKVSDACISWYKKHIDGKKLEKA